MLLGRCFVLPVLEYCSTVWCSAADTHLKLLVRVVIGANFLTGGVSVFGCDIAYRRSVAVLCMQDKIRCSPMNPLCMCQRGLHVVHWPHISTFMSFLAVEPCSTAGLFFPVSIYVEHSL